VSGSLGDSKEEVGHEIQLSGGAPSARSVPQPVVMWAAAPSKKGLVL
jgi:hypothetical protein